MADGLPGVRFHHIAEDPEGHIWFASADSGAARFDGSGFQTFTHQDGLCSNRVFHLLQDRRGRLWFATIGGVCWFDGGAFHALEADGVSGRSVHSLHEDRQGRIWCAGKETLGYYDGTAFHDLVPLYLQRYQEPPSPRWSNWCRGIAEDGQGHLWFGFDYLVRYDGTSFHRYEEGDGFPRAPASYVLGQDDAGQVWIGLPMDRDRLHRHADGAFHSMEVDFGGGALRGIQWDREGRGWFCTTEGAVYQDGDGFGRFTTADGLPHSRVRSVFRDREDRLWFATLNGVGLYDPYGINVLDFQAETPSLTEVSRIAQDRRGDLWFGYAHPDLHSRDRSVARLEDDRLVFVGTEDGRDINNCFAICEDAEGDLWFGGHEGLFRCDGQHLRRADPVAGLNGNGVGAIARDREGRFLFGLWEGRAETEEPHGSPLVIAWQRGSRCLAIFVEEEGEDPFTRIGTVVPGNGGEVWFHLRCPYSPGRGLARWHPEEGLRTYGLEDGLPDLRVTDLLLDRQGGLWIATLGGLARLDGGTFHTFTAEDGLPSNGVRCLFEDRRGHLWIGTHDGVAQYDGRVFQSIRTPPMGLVCRIFEDRDGTFWFGTVLGSVVRYRRRRTPPGVRLLQVVADRVHESPGEAVVFTSDPNVTFEYRGASLTTDPREMLYTYRLKGHDPDWRPATPEIRARYRALEPGRYTFQVMAVDRDLNYSAVAQARLSVEAGPCAGTGTPAHGRGGRELIGEGAAFRGFQLLLRKVASTDLAVLITGETGVGKGLAARTLHELSARRDGPFVQVDCGALPGTSLDSELFGHEEGAFTGALSPRPGKVETARDGTLFLDEIGDMKPETQARMLRLLEERTFERIGGSETLSVRTRVVASTSRDLEELVRTGDFREDLYYRLQAFPIRISPLRERRDEIPLLAEYFKDRMAADLGRKVDPLDPEVLEALKVYSWPGNVRELVHTVQRAVIVCEGPRIQAGDLGLPRQEAHAGAPAASRERAREARSLDR